MASAGISLSELEYANTLSTDDPEQFAAAMRKQFNRDIKIERVVAGLSELWQPVAAMADRASNTEDSLLKPVTLAS